MLPARTSRQKTEPVKVLFKPQASAADEIRIPSCCVVPVEGQGYENYIGLIFVVFQHDESALVKLLVRAFDSLDFAEAVFDPAPQFIFAA